MKAELKAGKERNEQKGTLSSCYSRHEIIQVMTEFVIIRVLAATFRQSKVRKNGRKSTDKKEKGKTKVSFQSFEVPTKMVF